MFLKIGFYGAALRRSAISLAIADHDILSFVCMTSIISDWCRKAIKQFIGKCFCQLNLCVWCVFTSLQMQIKSLGDIGMFLKIGFSGEAVRRSATSLAIANEDILLFVSMKSITSAWCRKTVRQFTGKCFWLSIESLCPVCLYITKNAAQIIGRTCR